MNEVIKQVDCSILCGERNEKEQNKAYDEGKSKVRFPDSKHNSSPSLAVDVAPWPIDWDDASRFYYFAGRVMAVASGKGYRLRFGGDWDGDMNLKDQSFNDLVHFEYMGKVETEER